MRALAYHAIYSMVFTEEVWKEDILLLMAAMKENDTFY